MTRTGDVSTAARTNEGRARGANTVLQTAGDARHENRKGDATAGLGADRSQANAEAGWSGRRHLPDGTARPVNVEGMRA
jgi:hypothetical protein